MYVCMLFIDYSGHYKIQIIQEKKQHITKINILQRNCTYIYIVMTVILVHCGSSISGYFIICLNIESKHINQFPVLASIYTY